MNHLGIAMIYLGIHHLIQKYYKLNDEFLEKVQNSIEKVTILNFIYFN